MRVHNQKCATAWMEIQIAHNEIISPPTAFVGIYLLEFIVNTTLVYYKSYRMQQLVKSLLVMKSPAPYLSSQ